MTSCAARDLATSSWNKPLPDASTASRKLHCAGDVTRHGWVPLGPLISKQSRTTGSSGGVRSKSRLCVKFSARRDRILASVRSESAVPTLMATYFDIFSSMASQAVEKVPWPSLCTIRYRWSSRSSM